MLLPGKHPCLQNRGIAILARFAYPRATGHGGQGQRLAPQGSKRSVDR